MRNPLSSPGVGMWDVYRAANDLDLYVECAKAIVHGTGFTPASRRPTHS